MAKRKCGRQCLLASWVFLFTFGTSIAVPIATPNIEPSFIDNGFFHDIEPRHLDLALEQELIAAMNNIELGGLRERSSTFSHTEPNQDLAKIDLTLNKDLKLQLLKKISTKKFVLKEDKVKAKYLIKGSISPTKMNIISRTLTPPNIFEQKDNIIKSFLDELVLKFDDTHQSNTKIRTKRRVNEEDEDLSLTESRQMKLENIYALLESQGINGQYRADDTVNEGYNTDIAARDKRPDSNFAALTTVPQLTQERSFNPDHMFDQLFNNPAQSSLAAISHNNQNPSGSLNQGQISPSNGRSKQGQLFNQVHKAVPSVAAVSHQNPNQHESLTKSQASSYNGHSNEVSVLESVLEDFGLSSLKYLLSGLTNTEKNKIYGDLIKALLLSKKRLGNTAQKYSATSNTQVLPHQLTNIGRNYRYTPPGHSQGSTYQSPVSGNKHGYSPHGYNHVMSHQSPAGGNKHGYSPPGYNHGASHQSGGNTHGYSPLGYNQDPSHQSPAGGNAHGYSPPGYNQGSSYQSLAGENKHGYSPPGYNLGASHNSPAGGNKHGYLPPGYNQGGSSYQTLTNPLKQNYGIVQSRPYGNFKPSRRTVLVRQDYIHLHNEHPVSTTIVVSSQIK